MQSAGTGCKTHRHALHLVRYYFAICFKEEEHAHPSVNLYRSIRHIRLQILHGISYQLQKYVAYL